ncbi:MCE family protein [Aeromicrobium phragmitis]|uniref:MCE family protein n=2 Tax=Aeromicrobium phragmitis TaxID=2478914 RepID=A0A3L8PQI0_9ACTN|nr:MCE family protein [Aeromicrobium phragmitis]
MLTLGATFFDQRDEYTALFEDATGVAKGDEVRIAGVHVGSVKSVEVVDTDKAQITFAVDEDVPLTENTHVTIKFRNLVGQRYIALTQGADGAGAPLEPGATIDTDRTNEALDLNVLLNGFKPVFQALSPEDTNQLAYEIVRTFQGESGNVETLLARTASLTSTLADRDELIGDVIVNLSTTLDMIGSRDQELTRTIDTLQQFVSGLAEDRDAILDSIDSISALSVETADLLEQGRPALAEDIRQLNALTANLSKDENLTKLSTSIQILPHKAEALGNAASSGSYFNFYLCELKGQLILPAIPLLGITEEIPLKLGGDEGLGAGGARCES